MTDAMRGHLQSALGTQYTLGRELGGGMSRVFVACDEPLGRDVVVKVLSPALAQDCSAQRFTRGSPSGWATRSARSRRTGRS